MRLIDNIKNKPTRHLISKQKNAAPIQPLQHQTNISPKQGSPIVESDKVYDPTIENFRACLKEVSGIGGEVIYEKHFAGATKLIKSQTAEIPDLLNFIANLISQIGYKASQNFFKRSGAKGERSESVSPYIKTLMSSLLKTTTPQVLRATLEAQLDDRIGKMTPPLKLPLDQSLKIYVTPILDEFFHAAVMEEKLKVDELFLKSEFPPDFKTIDIVFETAARLLVELKIKHFLSTMQGSMLTNLDSIVSKTIKINAQKITDILTCRTADLLQKMSYQPTFDKLIVILNQQVESIVTAEKVVDDLIAKAKLPESPKFEPDQKERIAAARKEIQNLGEQKYKQIKSAQAFSSEKGCHPVISNMIHLEEQDYETIEEIISSDMSDDLIKLFLPKKKVVINGKTTEIDGIDYLWRQLVLPPELSILTEQFKELIDKTMASETAKSFTGLKHPLYNFIENIVVTYAQEKTKSYLTEGIKVFLKDIVNPQLVKSITTEKLLPLAFDSMIPLFAQLVISEEIDKIVPLFKLVIDSPTSNESDETLLKTLHELVQAKAYYYNQAGKPISFSKFKETSKPLIEDIKKALVKCRTVEEADNTEILAKIKATLLTSFKYACAQLVETSKQADNQAYGILTKYMEDFPKQLEGVEQLKKDSIVAKLKEKLKPLYSKVKETGPQLDDQKALAMINPFIEEIRDMLHAKNISSETIKLQLTQFLATTKVNAPEMYGDLMVNLAFNLGKFEVMGFASSFVNAETVKGYMKETMRDVLFKLVDSIRKGYEEPINISTEILNETLGSKEKISKLIETKTALPAKDQVAIENEFQDGIKRTSALIFDIINKAIDLNIGPMNPLRGFVKGALGTDPSQIKKIMLNCFEKLTQNKLLLENIVLRMTDAVIMALNEADTKLKAQ